MQLFQVPIQAAVGGKKSWLGKTSKPCGKTSLAKMLRRRHFKEAKTSRKAEGGEEKK